MKTETDLTIHKSIVVKAPQEEAFRLFTEEASAWWPLGSHSLHGAEAETAVFEPRAGGRVFERTADGREGDWGYVLAWEPPGRLVISWQIGGAAGTEIEIRFSPAGIGTRVDLFHRGWEAVGAERQPDYLSGWDHVLGCYTAVAPEA